MATINILALPDNWIKGKRWLDGWEVSPKDKIKTEFEITKKTTVKAAPQTLNKTIAYTVYVKEKVRLRKRFHEALNKSDALWEKIATHFTGCNDCTVKDGVKTDIVTDCSDADYNLESDNVIFCGEAKSILQARQKADDIHSNALGAYDDYKSKTPPPKFDTKAAPRPTKAKAKATNQLKQSLKL